MQSSDEILFFTLLAPIILSACGGGSAKTTQLEGTWAFASAGHVAGEACGLDKYLHPEIRHTVTYAGNKFESKTDECIILSGNTGAFVQSYVVRGTFSIGDVYLAPGGAAGVYRVLDIYSLDSENIEVPYYTGYSITANELTFAYPTDTADGSSPDKRLNNVEIGLPVFIKLS